MNTEIMDYVYQYCHRDEQNGFVVEILLIDLCIEPLYIEQQSHGTEHIHCIVHLSLKVPISNEDHDVADDMPLLVEDSDDEDMHICVPDSTLDKE